MTDREAQRQRNRAAVSDFDAQFIDDMRERFNARLTEFDIEDERQHEAEALSPKTEVVG